MSKELTREEKSQAYIKGLKMTLNELQSRLHDQADGLSTKQLRRALKASVNYITTRTDDTDAKALPESEREFLGGMFAAIETSVQYAINVIGELQYKQDSVSEQVENQESVEKSDTKKGEENE